MKIIKSSSFSAFLSVLLITAFLLASVIAGEAAPKQDATQGAGQENSEKYLSGDGGYGGGGWGGGCRFGCCGPRGYGGQCYRCCLSAAEAAVLGNQNHVREKDATQERDQVNSVKYVSVDQGYGGGPGYGGGGGWGGGQCRFGCCGRVGYGGQCLRCCLPVAEAAAAASQNQVEEKDATQVNSEKYGDGYGGGYGGGGWGGGCRFGCCGPRGYGGQCYRCCATAAEAATAAKQNQAQKSGNEVSSMTEHGGGH